MGFLHWVLAITAPLLLVTGVGEHSQARPDWAFFQNYPEWLTPVRVIFWHRVLALLFTAALIPAVAIYLRDLAARAKQFKKTWFRIALQFVLLIGGLILLVSGVAMIRGLGGVSMEPVLRTIHFFAGVGLVGLALAGHTLLGLTKYSGMLGKTFSLTQGRGWVQMASFVVCLFACSALFLNWLDARAAGNVLIAKRIDPMAGSLDELPWTEAAPLSFGLSNGAKFRNGNTEMELRALHDGESVFVQAVWLDETEDRQNMPWKKTAEGWQHLFTDFKDETVYYEDKFSLVFPVEPSVLFDAVGCSMSCHAGGGHAYGFKSTPDLLDVWHWKATRTDPSGQVDDKYWNADGPELKNAGRHGDPKEGGGYERNWIEGEENGPAFLPGSDDAVKKGGLLRDKAIPLTSELEAKIPEGTIVPGMVVSPFEGDRGDVACRSNYQDGKWQLRMQRKLDTESGFDVIFRPGKTYSFGCAAFDRASKRHAYNAATYRLKLEE